MYYGSGHSIWRQSRGGRLWGRLPPTWRRCIVASLVTVLVTAIGGRLVGAVTGARRTARISSTR
jgi:hypothetical protein